MSVRVRYAPSPTGSPHVGNLRTAIFNWLFARKEGGRFVARLEDTDRDPSRYKPEYVHHIEASLRFLGIEPDEWWVNAGDAGYVQSARLAIYRQAADALIASGNAYRCYCTEERLAQMRERQQTQGLPTGYDRRCRYLSDADRARHEAEGLPFTLRLAVPLEGRTTYHDRVYGEITFENRLIDDQVLLKTNGWPTYHLAAVVDDHAMEITHVIRGEDWQPSTPKHVLLYQAFGWEQPIWVHVPLILGPDRKKLGKRHGATKFVDFMEQGYLPDALFNFLTLLGWSAGEENRELFTKEEIVERFSLEGITNHPAVFDYRKLLWMNGEYIRSSSPESLLERALPYLSQAGLIADPPTEEERTVATRAVALAADRMTLLPDAVGLTEYFFRDPQEVDDKGRRKWLNGPLAAVLLDRAAAVFGGEGEALTEARAEEIVDALGADVLQAMPEEERAAVRQQIEEGRGNPARARVIHTLRVATTGRTAGPGLFELLSVLGARRVANRLEHAKIWLV